MATETAVLERIPGALALSKLEAARMLGVSIRTVDRLSPKAFASAALGSTCANTSQ
jgi:hypothetical protein